MYVFLTEILQYAYMLCCNIDVYHLSSYIHLSPEYFLFMDILLSIFVHPFLVQDTTEAPSNPVDRTVWTFAQKATIELTQ